MEFWRLGCICDDKDTSVSMKGSEKPCILFSHLFYIVQCRKNCSVQHFPNLFSCGPLFYSHLDIPCKVDIFLFYRWRNWVSGKLTNLPMVVQLLNDTTKIWSLQAYYLISIVTEKYKGIHSFEYMGYFQLCLALFSCAIFNRFLFSSCSCHWDYVNKQTNKTTPCCYIQYICLEKVIKFYAVQ